ncbi:BTAD domain-containing putative transcriptional regulator [Nocardia sp. NPDC052566]|uniref:AfsR/SARP family transcriptional regulator n=1 Tax=Nocardia sp. NPDC052566 TaxID=3364330 RepID=UPI0037C6776C
MGVWFAVLGPVEIAVDGRVLAAPPRQRALLARLLIDAGRVHSLERLIEEIWGLDRPATARAQIHAALTGVRHVLREAGAEQVLRTETGGYVAQIAAGQFDLGEFTRRAAAGRDLAASDPHAAIAELRAALGLWRGQALADLESAYVPDMRAGLDDRRLATVEELMELELSLGAHERLLDELLALVAANPLREKLSGQLMLALHRAGRQTDALATARDFRVRLAEEQGLEPRAAFSELEQAVLRDDSRLRLPEAAAVAQIPTVAQTTAPAARRANFLPYDLPDFAGRDGELARLAGECAAADEPISAIDGMAGSGKTTLAVRVAHLLADRYPDGQLFIDLQGHTAGHAPVEAAAALEILLRQLGIAVEDIPAAAADRGALWRAELGRRRVIVVLDNAIDAAQVRPLLPAPAPSSRVLVTSRRRLVDLDAVRALSVEPLPAREAMRLFASIVGERAAAADIAVLDVVQLCGFLPLAVRIAGARLVHRPRWTVEYLAGRLRDERRRLAELSLGVRGVAAAFALSYEQLDPDQRRMFRCLGTHPGRDIDPHAAAALAAMPLERAEELLEELLDGHVVLQREPGRYTLHDLLREYARDLAAAEDTLDSRAAASIRLLDYYLHSMRAAVELQSYCVGFQQREVPAPAVAPMSFADAADAAGWLDAEYENLLAALGFAAEHGQHAHARDLANALRPYFDLQFRHVDAIDAYTVELHAAQALTDRDGEAAALINLGWVGWRQGDFERATGYSQRALDISRETGSGLFEARALNTLGNVARRRRDYGLAERYLLRSLELARAAGTRFGEANVLGNLGAVLAAMGRDDEACAHLDQALALQRESGTRFGEVMALQQLGLVSLRRNEFDRSRACYTQAVDLCRVLRNRGDEAVARNGLGAAARGAGELTEALAEHTAALALATEAGHRLEQAKAHEGLARTHRDLGAPDLARPHAEAARRYYEQLGLDAPNGSLPVE